MNKKQRTELCEKCIDAMGAHRVVTPSPVTRENIDEVLAMTDAPFAKYCHLIDANSCKQGRNPAHDQNPFHEMLTNLGFIYSHTTLICQIDGKTYYAHHTYKMGDWNIGIDCKPGWKVTGNKSASSHCTTKMGAFKVYDYLVYKAKQLSV